MPTETAGIVSGLREKSEPLTYISGSRNLGASLVPDSPDKHHNSSIYLGFEVSGLERLFV
jgi:hypothetical protein